MVSENARSGCTRSIPGHLPGNCSTGKTTCAAWFARAALATLWRQGNVKGRPMHTIIGGRFELQEQADAALAHLQQAGFPRDALAAFYLNPNGQHDIYPIGGDDKSSAGARESGMGAAKGGGIGAAVGAAAGVAATPVLGPVGIAIGAGLGAYTGSLVGAVSSTDKESDVDEQTGRPAVTQPEVTERAAGILVAVRVDDASRQRAIDTLSALGAADIEQATGTLRDGHWQDFDPHAVVRRV